jgi:hypothetical protein
LHIISHNDFGSTTLGTFPTATDPSQVAAIYIKEANNEGILIDSNLGYLYNKNVFVYSEAVLTEIIKNQIECGVGNYAVDMQVDNCKIIGNYFNIPGPAAGSLGAIAVRKTSDLSQLKYYVQIKNNLIYGSDGYNSIYGVFARSIISGNIIHAKRGITLHNSIRNNIENNVIYGSDTPNGGIVETGNSDYNILLGNDVIGTTIVTVGANTKINHCWNDATWIG